MDNFDDLRAALGDHKRGCEGRDYTCTCGFDDAMAARVAVLEAALREVEQEAHGIARSWVQDGCDSGSAIGEMQSIADMASAALGDAR